MFVATAHEIGSTNFGQKDINDVIIRILGDKHDDAPHDAVGEGDSAFSSCEWNPSQGMTD